MSADLAQVLAEREEALVAREVAVAEHEADLAARERLLDERQADYRETRHAMRRARAVA